MKGLKSAPYPHTHTHTHTCLKYSTSGMLSLSCTSRRRATISWVSSWRCTSTSGLRHCGKGNRGRDAHTEDIQAFVRSEGKKKRQERR